MLEMKEPLILWAALAIILIFTPSTEQNRSPTSSVKPWSSSESDTSEQTSEQTSEEISKEHKKKPRHDRCERNEQRVNCPFAVCVPKTCDDVGAPVPCPDLLPNATCPGGPGCICRENYVKNKKGVCIPMKQCPSCGGDKNAVSGCGYNCNRLCSNYNNSRLQTECPEECLYNSCDCKRDFVFDEIKKICVKPKDCSKLKCNKKRGEVYDPCPAPCPLRTCGIDDEAVDCGPVLFPGHTDCAPPKCRCKDGLYRDDKGNCVTKDKCPTCSGVNEMYDPCPNPCPGQRCDVNPALVLCLPAPPIGDPRCEPGCRCIDGYVRNYTGNVCINREDCPTCPQDEIYDICDKPCPPRRCDVDERLIKCAAPPKPGDPGCVEGCRCVDGYKRDYNGVCILAEDCSTCPQNEIYDICDRPCPARRCDVDERLIKCAAPPKPGDPDCVKGCRCIDGYKRDNNGVCIPAEDCPKCTNLHEVYDPCPPTCPPQTCESINKVYHCPNQPIGKKGKIIRKCVGQCVCEPGYYRNKIGECTSEENCLKCTGPHEFFSCGSACDNVCGLLNKENQTNCPIINIKCNDKCYCEDGYARDQNNICVPIKDCKVPKCKKHESYNACPAYLCQLFNCSQLGFPVYCPSFPDYAKCPLNPGCICDNGYVRDDVTGRCILKEHCPSCGGDNNATSGCGVNCNKRCRDVGKKPGACLEICYENECDCKNGYYLDENTDLCVKPEDCSPVCPIDEIYSECIQDNRGPKKCSELGFPVRCENIDPKFCKKGCICRDGKVRNSKGICVNRSECPSCGGDPNAQSGCGLYCNRRCSDIDQEPEVCVGLCYDNACDCKDGYYFDEDCEKCVHPEDCPQPKCKKNEYFNNCSNSDCSPQNCNDLGFSITCADIGDPCQCTEDCLCNEGYVRNDKGICIPSRECPSCGGDPNAVSGCGGYCNQKCSSIGKEPEACILLCEINGCDCREGFYYDEIQNLCVAPEDCTPQCPKNEHYSNCTNGDCSVQNCNDVGFGLKECPQIKPEDCKEGCLCDDGYARNKKGVCVPKYKCPKCKGDPNQVSGCGVYCNQKCADIGKEPGACILICYVESCDCREGYYLDANTGKCVKPEDCSPQCPDNEYYSNCTNGNCGVQSCKDVGLPLKFCARIDPKNCKKGCLCNQGYARNDKGICVPLKECQANNVVGFWNSETGHQLDSKPLDQDLPTCKCDPNRVSGCGVYCNQRCSDIGLEPGACIDVCYENECDCREGYYLDTKTDKCVLPQNCSSCKSDPNRVPGCGVYCNQRCADVGKKPGACTAVCYDNACDCKKGYFLDENIDKCVKPKECTPVCGDNEVYSDCINGGCDAKNCSQLGKDVPCVKLRPESCIKGCLCLKGYLRTKNGVCVPESECNPKLCPRPHEEYNSCFYNCPPQTCESLDRVYACPIRQGDKCKAQCICKSGYFRNTLGECISEANCRKCMGPHEYFSCGGACDNVCATIKKQNQTKCPIVNVKCNEMCYCEKNYARARNNTCIPIDKCNENQCEVNARYEKCPQKLPGPFTCNQLGFPVEDNSKKPCGKHACVCVDGYVRDSNKVCILKADCPSCGGDENAVSGCGNCIDICEDLANDEPKFCTEICYENACDCREGYYYDKKQKKCVLPEQCTSICSDDEYEYYENCTNPRCRAQTCDELGFPLNCSTDSSDCKKGCYCKDNFVRNKDGKCIPVEDCPSCGGDVNAKSGCGVNCLKHCYDLANPKHPRPCKKICKVNSCDCKDGYYLDENIGKCVKAKECSPICGKNEVFDFCINGGCGFKNCSEIGGPQICIDPIKCIKGCSCKKDYLRAKNGTCIPVEKCPEAKCPKNERFEKCPAELCLPQTCDELGTKVPCFPVDESFCPGGPSCICRDNYVRNKHGKCIPNRQCPSCGGDPNAWSGCGVNCGKHCDDVFNKTRPCPRICYPNSCDCKDGFFYDEVTEKCVKSDDCTPPCLENEQRDLCVNGYCGIRYCSQANGPELCVDPIECEVGCTCVEGYLREDKSGVCVPECECPIPPKKCTETECAVCIDCTDGPPVDETTAIANFELGNDLLCKEFLYQLVEGRPGESFMFSALSVLIALAQLTLYAVGATLEQLLRILNLKTKDEVRTIFPILIKNYQAQKSVVFEMAFKNYGSNAHPFTEKFKKEAVAIFNSEGQNIDFAKNVEAADIINKWVRERTNNLIDNLVNPSMFSEATRMVLVNALYFLGDWVYQFNPNETKPQNFYYGKSDKDVLSLPTMCQKRRFLYAESDELDCQILQLPYKGENFTFNIYLPRTRDGLKSMVEKIRNTDNIFAKTRESLEYQTVRACLPKMDISTDISDLAELLKMANLTAPFDPNSDGFECIFEDESSVVITDAIQKSRIKVDELGTEAAVATAVVLTYRSVRPTSVYTFNADHPFLFIIRFLDDIIVLAGVFYK